MRIIALCFQPESNAGSDTNGLEKVDSEDISKHVSPFKNGHVSKHFHDNTIGSR